MPEDSSMKESETQTIQVKDSPSRGVSLFLETLHPAASGLRTAKKTKQNGRF